MNMTISSISDMHTQYKNNISRIVLLGSSEDLIRTLPKMEDLGRVKIKRFDGPIEKSNDEQ